MSNIGDTASTVATTAAGAAGNVTMQIDITILEKLNNDVDTIRNEIKTTMKNIQSCCDELKSNIKGTQVNNSISAISENIANIDSKMGGAFDQLTSFLVNQMQNYTTTYQNASVNLKTALNFIDTNF